MLNSHGYSDLQIQIIVALTETSPTMENCAVMSHAMCFTKAFICSLCSILIVTFPGAFTYKTFTPSLGKSSTFNQCNMVSSPFSSQWTPSHLQWLKEIFLICLKRCHGTLNWEWLYYQWIDTDRFWFLPCWASFVWDVKGMFDAHNWGETGCIHSFTILVWLAQVMNFPTAWIIYGFVLLQKQAPRGIKSSKIKLTKITWIFKENTPYSG